MKKLILILLAGLMLAAPVSGKILAVNCNGDATYNATDTPAINNLWTNIVRMAGLSPQSWDVIPLNSMNADSTAYLIEEYGASGDYDLIVFLNTPALNAAGNRTHAEMATSGMAKFDVWIGPSDVTITTDILVLLPTYPTGSTGTIWYDSLGTDKHATRSDTPVWNESSDAKTYAWVRNEDGDSLFMSTHEDVAHAYVRASRSNITIPSWRTDTNPDIAAYADSVRAYVWISEKDNGSKVWIVPRAAHSSEYGYSLTIISMYEPSFTPIDFSTVVTEFGVTADSTGCSVNFSNYLDWCEANDWKVTFSVSEDQSDAGVGSWINPFHTRLQANDNYQLTMDGYVAFPFRSNANTAANIASVTAGIDSFLADPNWSGVDTTYIYPYRGIYAKAPGGDNVQELINLVFAPYGQTDLLTRSNADTLGWPYTLLGGGLEGASLFYAGATPTRIRTHPLGASYPPGADSLSFNNLSYHMNTACKMQVGAMGWVQAGEGDVHLDDSDKADAADIAKVGMYTGNTYVSCSSFRDHAVDYLGTYKISMGLPDYNALLTVKFAKEWMDFHNHIAARYTKTGIVPFRNVFIRDVHYDRVLDREYPNQHVTEGGYE